MKLHRGCTFHGLKCPWSEPQRVHGVSQRGFIRLSYGHPVSGLETMFLSTVCMYITALQFGYPVFEFNFDAQLSNSGQNFGCYPLEMFMCTPCLVICFYLCGLMEVFTRDKGFVKITAVGLGFFSSKLTFHMSRPTVLPLKESSGMYYLCAQPDLGPGRCEGGCPSPSYSTHGDKITCDIN